MKLKLSCLFLFFIAFSANANNVFKVSESAKGISSLASDVAINSYGESLIVWTSVDVTTSADDTNRWVSARVIDAESNPITDIFSIPIPQGYYTDQIRPAIFDDGSIVIAWALNSNLMPEDDGYNYPAIYAQKFDISGNPVGEQSVVAVSEQGAYPRWFQNLDISYSPDSEMNVYCLSWSLPGEYIEDDEEYNVYVHSTCKSTIFPNYDGRLFFDKDLKCTYEHCTDQVLAHPGSPIVALDYSGEIHSVLSTAVSTDFYTIFDGEPDFITRLVDMHSNGNLTVVLWSLEESNKRNDDVFDEEGIYARVVDLSGEPVTDIIKVADANIYGPSDANVAMYSDGSFVVIENEAYYVVYSATGEVIMPLARFVDPNSEYHSNINSCSFDINSEDQIIMSFDSSYSDIYAAQTFQDLSIIDVAKNSETDSSGSGGCLSLTALVLLLGLAFIRINK
ncbi:MAG: hypothetical protein D6B28_07895 [Gammaproteobacteria bacterium]|nr:MAG: hypothetical protein D6B28_07895 [Gammaproteobacteria bacterium]